MGKVVFFFQWEAERQFHLIASSLGAPNQLCILFSLLIFATSVAAVKKKNKNMQIRIEETIWVEQRHTETQGNFLWVPSCWVIINPDVRDSGILCPTSLHLPDIRPPTTPCSSSPQLQKHPLCKFYNHATAKKYVCVRTVKRGYKLLLSIWNELGLEWDKEQSEERREYYEQRECYKRGHS